jgi:hypothetical protein
MLNTVGLLRFCQNLYGHLCGKLQYGEFCFNARASELNTNNQRSSILIREPSTSGVFVMNRSVGHSYECVSQQYQTADKNLICRFLSAWRWCFVAEWLGLDFRKYRDSLVFRVSGRMRLKMKAPDCSRSKKPVRKVSSHFEDLENRSRGLDVTWQPIR